MNSEGSSGCTLIVAAAVFLCGVLLRAEPVTVRYAEGGVHGFLVLRTLDGTSIADGDLIQVARGARVTSRMVFHFKDGSVHDETAVFSQELQFRLISDHLVQKGPVFPLPLDMSIDGASGQIIVRYTSEHGEQKQESERLTLPPDLANGLVPTLLKNVSPDALPKSFSMIVATPKPRLVKLAISSEGQEPFSTGGAGREATEYILKGEIGGGRGPR